MPEPLQRSARYMPALDGLRALAVAAVIAYHLGLTWAPGGLLGVGVFFTLSGYLITDLLLGGWDGRRLALADFWRRRARRLLPALYVMLALVVVWVALASPQRIGDVRGQTLSALLYLNNWWQITRHVSYFARFGPPSPLGHLWSLAVEEQFYLLWPWLLLAGLRLFGRRDGRRGNRARPGLALVVLALAGASALEMALLYHPSIDNTRIYDGTDTRAFGLLIGAALALVWPSRALTGPVTERARWILDLLGLGGLVAIAVLVWRTDQYSPFMYRGGLVLLSLATALVIAAAAHPASRLARALGARPLRWIGVRSYAIYLWHEPIIVLTTPAYSQTVAPVRALAQVAATVALAALSWRFVEEPVRHGALGRAWSRARAARWRMRRLPSAWRACDGACALMATVAVLGLAGVTAPGQGLSALSAAAVGPTGGAGTPGDDSGSGGGGTGVASGSAGAGGSQAAGGSAPGGRTGDGGKAGSGPAGGGTPSGSGGTASGSVGSAGGPAGTKGGPGGSRAAADRTSCSSVVHIGDSTSDGLTSSNYLPDPAQRMPEQYARVGVRRSIMRITGGTSIVETLPGTVDARTVAKRLVDAGYRGCWVLALGTNDAADVYVGSSVGDAQRIREMMSTIGDQPVMWVNVKTLNSGGPYAERNMQGWNRALVRACARYPNMRVFDWASVARRRWFIPDGIHYYSPGYAARAHMIADALAQAFPAGGPPSPTCVVHVAPVSIPVLGVGH